MADLIPYGLPEDDSEDHEKLGSPFLVKARIYNNRLVQARREMGFQTIASAARALGLNHQKICNFETLRDLPWNEKKLTWKPSALAIADAYGYSPEELWPDVIQKVRQRYMEIEASSSSFVSTHLEEAIERAELVSRTRVALKRLTPREERVISRRFGLDSDERTIDEIAEETGVTRTRISQIEHKALRKLRHPANHRELILFFPEAKPYHQEIDLFEITKRRQESKQEDEKKQKAKQETRQGTVKQEDFDAVVWCTHLDAELILSDQHWFPLPNTQIDHVQIDWLVECEKCHLIHQNTLNTTKLRIEVRGPRIMSKTEIFKAR